MPDNKMQKGQYADRMAEWLKRADDIVDRRGKGETWAAIGRIYGISGNRAHQIYVHKLKNKPQSWTVGGHKVGWNVKDA